MSPALTTALVLGAVGVAVVAMLAYALRWVIGLATQEARAATCEATAREAKEIATRAMAVATKAEAHASRRADAIHAQYLSRERQARKRKRDAEEEQEEEQPAAGAAGYDHDRAVAEWLRKNGNLG